MKKIRGIGIVSLVLCLILIVSIKTVHLSVKAAEVETTVTWLSKDYDTVQYLDFSEGMIPVHLNGKVGFIDTTGKEVIATKYDEESNFSDGLATVRLGEKWGVIDKTGRVVIPFKYDMISIYSEGLAIVGIRDIDFNFKYGFMDKKGKVVIPIKYDNVEFFSEGLAAVVLRDKLGLNSKCGYIDKTGKVVIPLKYTTADSFSEGLAAVRMNGELGFLDKTGKVVIPLKYDMAGYFSEDLASVRFNYKWGFIDKKGKVIIPFKYDGAGYINDAPSFSGGRARVSIITKSHAGDYANNVIGYDEYTDLEIDKMGNEIKPLEIEKYSVVGTLSEGFAYALNGDKKFGYIDISGNEVIPFKYDKVSDFNDGVAFVEIGDKVGILKISTPKIAIVSLDHSPFVEGDNNEFYISAKGYTGQVQYQLFYIQESVMKEWKLINNADMINGWTNPIDAQAPINVDISSLNLKADKYRFAIRVRRVGVKGLKQNSYGDYDDAYPFNLDVVKNADIKLGDNINIEKTNFTKSENLVISGVGNLSKDIQYKLHLFDVKNNKWLTDLTEYNTDVNYSLKDIPQGTYIVDLWARNINSNTKYDGWKLKVITITE